MKPKQRHSLQEVARQCGLTPDIIIRFISFEWIVPAEDHEHPSQSQSRDSTQNPRTLQQPLLDEEDIARARLIWELQKEFGVNDEAVPIILHLIDQLNRIHLEAKER